jgi:signal transduction histidine kinase/ligand-binding sensor domain-containing protein/DNA-binding response OmpR family regulator
LSFSFPPLRAVLRLSLLLLFTWATGIGWAQPIAPDQYRFEHLTVDQGLSHSDATAVAQDQAGFIWVGTNRGLDRYDGYTLKPYELPINPLNRMSANRITVLHVAASGQLWIGSDRAGISYYDAHADRLRALDSLAVPAASVPLLRSLMRRTITALVTDRAGRLWVGSEEGYLFRLSFDAQGRIVQLREVPPRTRQPLGRYAVRSLAADADGAVWVGTSNYGLGVIRPQNQALTVEPTAVTGDVRAVHIDQRGELWAGVANKLLWASAASRRAGPALAVQSLPHNFGHIYALRRDSFGNMWVGTNFGLCIWAAGVATGAAPPLHPGPPTLLLPQDGNRFSINSERIHQIFEDRNQLMWLCASAGGLNRVDLRQKPFGWLRREMAGLTTHHNNYVNAIYKEEGRNLLWFGTRNGLTAYDFSRQTYRDYFSSQSASQPYGVDVVSVFQSSNGTLWCGTRGGGLLSLRWRGDHYQLQTYLQIAPGVNLQQANIERIAEDRYGTLWLATNKFGLLRLSQEGKLLAGAQAGRLPSSVLNYLLYDRQRDVLWVSTSDAGLLKLRVTATSATLLRQFKSPASPTATDGLAVNLLWPLLLDRQGALWIGTIGGGLHRLRTDAHGHDVIERYRQWLPESDVESLLADEAGNIWVGGTGLYRFAPATHQYVRYDVADGLQSNAFKIGAAAKGADGTLYFGGINGITSFQPRDIKPNPHPPVVQLTGLHIANQPVAVGQELNGRVVLKQPLSVPQTVVIKASENDFAVDFVGLNYANPQKNRYAYRLVGYNQDWVRPAPGQRTASFANLPAGQYVLQVKASNGEGGWSKQLATMRFDVRAPWYKTGWAYLLFAALAGGAVWLYRRAEMAQQTLQNKLVLEQFQAEKEKELTDLKLGFFTNVSHELRTPLTLILGPAEELLRSPGPVPDLRGKVSLIHQQARKLLELVNQLLDFRKMENGHIPLRAGRYDAVPFLTDLYAVFRLQAREQALHYELRVPGQPLLLYFDQGKLEVILTNLLVNAFKYTPAEGRVELAAQTIGEATGEAVYSGKELTDNYLQITVADSGVGIAAHELDRIFEPYYQASHTGALRLVGTGIGLSLARQFAAGHGGQLLVRSTVGMGTTFELRLPLGRQHLRPEDLLPEPAPAVEDAALAPELLAPASEEEELVGEADVPPLGSPARVLVVEDNDEVRQYLTQLFETTYEVLTAADGVAGWQQALAQLPDLVVSDVMMPHSDGLDLCQRLKQHPKTSHIPLLLLTARTAETHELEGMGMGADAYMTKPFNPRLLLAKVDAMLRYRRKLHAYYQRQLLLEPTDIVVADADREFLEQSMAAVEKYLEDPEFGVQALVRAMAMSQSVFYRRLKSITGQTAVEFIRDVRMKRAAQLLSQSQMRVSEVAALVGISDAKYFGKTFQRVYNMSPTEFVRQHRPGRETPPPAGPEA